MVEFNYQIEEPLDNEVVYALWLENIARSEKRSIGDLSFVFCTDLFLHELNLEHLNHDTLTDIITFDYCEDDILNGEIYISIDRVKDNAITFRTGFKNELHRVMAHGVLHLCGFGDKTPEEKDLMSFKEDEKINMFHVKQ